MNESIRARELRVIHPEQGNLGVISTEEAIKIAREQGLDLIEISSDTKPPIAKIMDYGQYQYEQKKKQKEIKAKQKTASTEVKSIQVKIGTGENDMMVKAKRASEWLAEGNRVKVELYLRGRSKYLEKGFLHERLQRLLDMLTVEHKLVDEIKKSPKGIMTTIEVVNKK
jgi:translation initiation factor IF-3